MERRSRLDTYHPPALNSAGGSIWEALPSCTLLRTQSTLSQNCSRDIAAHRSPPGTCSAVIPASRARFSRLEALRRELGLDGMVRFLQLFIRGSGDYTAERAELLGNPSVAEIIEAFEKRRAAEAEEGREQ